MHGVEGIAEHLDYIPANRYGEHGSFISMELLGTTF